MNTLLYWMARGAVAMLQALPLRTVARVGRAAGALAHWIDGRHRRVARHNLTLCFGAEMSPAEIRALAKENFRRIGESYCCAIKTASMSDDEIRGVLEFRGGEKLFSKPASLQLENWVMAVGHFGNFELYARCAMFAPGYQVATTYRALRQPALNRLVQLLRQKSGCLYFERRHEGAALKAALNRGGVVLGLLADQHAGNNGLRLPLLGQDCSTSTAPAVLALRYHCRLFCAICYRTEPGRWRVEIGAEIPTHVDGQPRPVDAVTLDVNRAYEAAIRRDPANWFWVHKRWKPGKWRSSTPSTTTAATAA